MKRFDLLHTPLAGRNLIEASAGTGKTFTIAGVYLRLVLEEGLDVSRILVVTFTEAATKELKERIRKKLKDAEEAFQTGASDDFLIAGIMERTTDHARARRLLASAVRSFDEAAIFTIHGFCQRMLQDNPFESGSLCDTELVTDQGKILSEIAQDYWRINCYGASVARISAADHAKVTPESLLKLAKRVSGDPNAGVVPAAPAATEEMSGWLLALKRNFFDYLRKELPKRKRLKNVRSFDDLLSDLHAALTRAGSTLPRLIRERYEAALIDEFQDTDPVQFAIFDAVYPADCDHPFFLIGDPKQAIYSFRGADIFAYMGAAEATKKRHTLLRNFRSEATHIEAVNAIFASRELPFLHEKIGFKKVEAAPKESSILTEHGERKAPLKFWFVPRNEPGKPINKGDAWDLLPETVASEIARLLRDASAGKLTVDELKKEGEEERRQVRPRDIAVLVRANHQAKLMQQALTRRGIPSVLCNAGNLFESDEASELLRLLSAVAQPGHEALLRGALATDLVGVSGTGLAALIDDEDKWEEILEEFRGYHDTWNAGSCMAMALQFMERRKVRERLLAGPMGERRLTNVLHAVETVHQAQVKERLGMEGVVTWLCGRITEDPKKEEYEVRLETDEEAVQLVTIHKSKGLEYPIVFLPFSWAEPGNKDEGALFHDDSGRVVLDIGSADMEQSRAKAAQEALAESLRLLYVALTRGKHRTYLVWGAFKDAGESSLHYLLHPGASSLKGQVSICDEEILKRLEEVAASSPGNIEVLTMPPADMKGYRASGEQTLELAPSVFTGTIPRDWRVASFTSLSSRQHHAVHTAELPDHDEVSVGGENPARDVEPAGIFAFPKGAKAGIFLHKIFEELDFTQSATRLAPLVEDQLDKHGFSADWKQAVCDMAGNVLQAPLGDRGITLAQVGPERRLTELEFFFPLAALTSERLTEAAERFMAARGVETVFPVDMAELFSRLSFAPVRGMLLGFIDLVFEQDGRYYIVDWKSNHLGNSPSDYGQAALRREMEENFYPLQYLLYTVALDNYLRLRIAGYDYDRHFGGVFYLFLRGVDGAGHGVFADRPPKEFINELAAALLPEALHQAEAQPSPPPSPGGRGRVDRKSKKIADQQLSLDLF